MSDRILFGNTVLPAMNKAGILKPDSDGYYTVVLGALGVKNSAGEIYVDTQVARDTFSQNSKLMQRINRGLLRAEWGHPDPSNYSNMMAFERRIRTIQEDRICANISKIWLEDIRTEDGKIMKGILGKVKPSGPFGQYLKEMLDDPHQNVTFSGRYFSNLGFMNGVRTREIHTCATWDFVSEPGIACAQKYLSPTLESLNDTLILPENVKDIIEYEESHRDLLMSMESSGVTAHDAYERFNLANLNRAFNSNHLNW